MNRVLAIVSAIVVSALVSGHAVAVDLPYTGNGDPLGLTSSKGPDALIKTTAFAIDFEVPYTGSGDPKSLVSGGMDPNFAIETGSVPRRTQVPYTGFGDPDDLI